MCLKRSRHRSPDKRSTRARGRQSYFGHPRMVETTTFAASGEEVISRQIHVETDEIPRDLSQQEFEEYFDIERTVAEVLKGDYKRVCVTSN